MLAQTAFLRSLGVEIFASGHRRWSEAVKAQAVAETLEPGAAIINLSAIPEAQRDAEMFGSVPVARTQESG